MIEKDLGAVTAYAIAVANGFEGTEEEWLASLRYDHSDEFMVLVKQIESAAALVDTAKEEAAQAATDAEAAAEQADIYKQDAESSATAAGAAKTDALTAQANAEKAQEAAESAASAAQTSAGNAASSATEASGYKDSAATSASAASGSAEAASNSAQTATNKATEAAQSASDAQGYASAASGSATTAGGYAEDAEGSATEAAQSASDAAGSASTAQGFAQNAASSATTATQAKDNAEEAAQSAQGYASQAAGSAEDASEAVTAAETAKTGAVAAQTAAEEAAQQLANVINDDVMSSESTWSSEQNAYAFGVETEQTGQVVTFTKAIEPAPIAMTATYGVYQSGSGDPSPSNIRPFTSIEDLCVLAMPGEHLIDTSLGDTANVSGLGECFVLGSAPLSFASDDNGITPITPLMQGKTYTLSFYSVPIETSLTSRASLSPFTTQTAVYICNNKLDAPVLLGHINPNELTFTFAHTDATDLYYILLNNGMSWQAQGFNRWQLEYGDTSTGRADCEPLSVAYYHYLGTLLDIECDFTTLSYTSYWDVLLLNWITDEFWAEYTDGDFGEDVRIFYAALNLPNEEPYVVDGPNTTLCTHFKNVSNEMALPSTPWTYTDDASNSNRYFAVPKTQFADVSAWVAYLGQCNDDNNPIQLGVKHLAPYATGELIPGPTPAPRSLRSTQTEPSIDSITSTGLNNLWAAAHYSGHSSQGDLVAYCNMPQINLSTLTTTNSAITQLRNETASAREELQTEIQEIISDTDTASDSTWSSNKIADTLNSYRIYHQWGVKIPATSETQCVRMYDAEGMTAAAHLGSYDASLQNDFDDVPLMKARAERINYDIANQRILAIEGDSNFKTDGTNGDVFVRQIAHWHKREILPDGSEIRAIADGPLPGYEYVPERLIPCYLASAADADSETNNATGTLRSISGARPLTWVSLQNFYEKAKNTGCTIMDMDTYADQADMMLVEFANRNMQAAIGNGFVGAAYGNTYLALMAETDVNRVVLTTTQANQYLIGQYISIGSTQYSTDIARFRQITAIDVVNAGQGWSSLTFDGDPVDIAIGNYVSGNMLPCGGADAILAGSGYIGTNDKAQVKYRGVEDVYGNVFQGLLGVLKVGTHPPIYYYCDQADYYGFAIDEHWREIARHEDGDNEGYVREVFDNFTAPLASSLIAKVVTGASNMTYWCDYYYRTPINETPEPTRVRVPFFGGYWLNGSNAGPWYGDWHCAPSSTNWRYGARPLVIPPWGVRGA